MPSLLDRSVPTTGGATPQFQPSGATGSFYREVSAGLKQTSEDMKAKADSIYINSFVTEARQGAKDIYDANSDNPDQLNKELAKHKEGLLSNIPAGLSPRLGTEYDSMSESYLNRATNLANEKLTSERRLALEQNEFKTTSNVLDVADDLFRNNRNLTPQQIAAKSAVAINAFAVGSEALKANWSSVGADGKRLFTDEQILARDNKLKQAIFSRGAKSYLDASPNKLKAYENWINNKVSIETPEGSINIRDAMSPDVKEKVDADLRAAFKEDLYIKKQYLDDKKAATTQAVDNTRFMGAVSGNFLLDYHNKEDKALVNSNYEARLQNSPDPIGLGKEIAVKTGIVPSELERYINANINNGAPEQRVQASKAMLDLFKGKASLQNQFGAKEIAFAVELDSRVSAGIPIEKAIEYSENQLSVNKSQDRILREGKFNLEYGDLERSKKSIKAIKKVVDDLKDDSGFFSEAKAPTQMGIELTRAAKDFYLNEGLEMDKAMEAAEIKVKGEWGVTEVGSRRFQKYAPEKFYSVPNYDNKWIENQAIQEVKRNIGAGIPEKELRKQILLEPIPETLTGKPSYKMYRKDEFGAYHNVLGKDNQPVTFKPDFSKTDEFRKAQAERRALMLSPEKEDVFRARQKKVIKGLSEPFDFSKFQSPTL